MPNFMFTDFSKRRGSPFQNNVMDTEQTEKPAKFDENFEVTAITDKNKLIQAELIEKAYKKSAEIASHKPSECEGYFTEVTTAGAFTSPKTNSSSTEVKKSPQKFPPTHTPANISKALLGFPSSANTLALEAKADLESDPKMSQKVKNTVITKLFTLATMVQHVYESKVRILSDFDKFKEKHFKDELRREKEHSEQLYKINMTFQNELVQMIQQLKSEIDASKLMTKEDISDNERESEDSKSQYEVSENLEKDEIESHEKTDLEKEATNEFEKEDNSRLNFDANVE